MSKGVQNFLRWVVVLPCSIAAAFLSTFVLHFILYNTLTKFVTPYPEFPERALVPFVIALVFIWCGAAIAPNYKLRTAVVLFSAWMFFAGGVIMSTLTGGKWFGYELELDASGVAPVMGIVGAFVGLYLVRNKNKEAHPRNVKEDVVPNISSEVDVQEISDKQSFFEKYLVEIIYVVFIALFVWCLWSSTARYIIFPLLILGNLFEVISLFKKKLHTTAARKKHIAMKLFLLLVLIVGLINSTTGLYATIILVAFQTFELFKRITVTHIMVKGQP